jgi:hypothetical protein
MFSQYQPDPPVHLLWLWQAPGPRTDARHLFHQIFYLLLVLPIRDVPDECDHAIGLDMDVNLTAGKQIGLYAWGQPLGPYGCLNRSAHSLWLWGVRWSRWWRSGVPCDVPHSGNLSKVAFHHLLHRI